ncbi:MAG TPA: C25 family cysteine peptidase, partial [Candidatus Krumholzibacterium sp.]|nr:C25 family cysteine peptidase [Candidatus Krumholzibacterium sp.]
VNLYPCRVVPSTGRLIFSARLRVTITTRPEGGGLPSYIGGRDRAPMRRILADVQNPEAVAATAHDLPRDVSRGELSAAGSSNVPYLIITSADLAASFSRIASLKEMMGLKTMIKTVESIAIEMPGADLQEQIRNYIIYACQQYQTEYVLLGGDSEIIPPRPLYVKAGTEIEPDIPSDLYYAALDGDWNTDGDAYFGEPGEDDLIPEVTLGRLPASEASQVLVFSDKLEKYTLYPDPSSCTTSLMLGELLWDDIVTTWGGDYKDEILYGTDNFGFTTAGIPAGFDNGTLYDRDLGNWTISNLLPLLDAGVNLVNHLGHSAIHTVMNIPIWEVANLTGDGPGWIPFVCYSQGCYPAAFDNR